MVVGLEIMRARGFI